MTGTLWFRHILIISFSVQSCSAGMIIPHVVTTLSLSDPVLIGSGFYDVQFLRGPVFLWVSVLVMDARLVIGGERGK